MKLNAKIHKLLSDMGLGDRKAAQKVGGVSATTVGRWRKGEGEPSLSEAARLARVCGVTLDFLADDAAEFSSESGRDDWDVTLRTLTRQLGSEQVCRMLLGVLPEALRALANEPASRTKVIEGQRRSDAG